MCGISGIIYKDQKADTKEVHRMMKAQSHRGPDASGSYVFNNLAIGSNRLAIIDLDHRSDQPMHGHGFHIIFNGAIYNFIELKATLRLAGFQFKTESDTEVILAAYKKWGQKCVAHFNGMWAFAIVDTKLNEVFCSRDRFGIKPFYYLQNQRCIGFASEIKALETMDDWSAKLNETKAIEYLAFGLQDHTHQTMFDQVFQLEPGENMTIDLEKCTLVKDRFCSWTKDENNIQERGAKDLIKKELMRSIGWRMRADVSIGSCLSGGIDSSAIVCGIKEQNYKIETFSAVYSQKDISEKKYIEAVNKKTNFLNHQISPSPKSFFDEMQKMVQIQDEPFSTTSIFAQNKVFEKAKSKGVKVMMDGQGADEIFAGYEGFIPIYLKNLSLPEKILQSLKFGFQHLKEFQKLYSRYLHKKRKNKNSIPDLLNFDGKLKIQLYNPKSITEKSIQLLQNMGLRALLHYEDRNSMFHSIESRLPFLDDQMVQIAIDLPDRYKIKDGIRKFILRKSMSNILPKIVLERYTKLGFETPHDKWILDNLEDIKKTIIQNTKAAKLINMDKVETTQDKNLLFRAYLFVIWLDTFEIEV